MRSTSLDASVRLYYLDDSEGSMATTLLYGTLAEVMARAAAEPPEVQAGLYLQTVNDVVSYCDFIDG